MADYRRMRPGFSGTYADQLSISGPIGGGSGEELGMDLSYVGSSGSSESSFDWGRVADITSTAVVTAGQVATSVWGHPQYSQSQPVYPGYTPHPGTAVGMLSGVNINMLVLAGLGALAILMLSQKKSS